ncbi:gb [Venturia nashicola]|uniref:Gb n=1 Tax=Venturia nashicola TaxID=86259 RepID=A0A4Z1NSB1_9PEZI|nr:gb [Venturia nashicola]TLD28136.1 gb [Venturia nashicola]
MSQVWRPINTVYKHSLCIASAPSVPNSNLVIRPTRMSQESNESLRAKYSPRHQWYYKSFHQPDEVFVFKQFDKYGNAKVRKCAHTAFVDEEFENAKTRESIELRVFLFWPDSF